MGVRLGIAGLILGGIVGAILGSVTFDTKGALAIALTVGYLVAIVVSLLIRGSSGLRSRAPVRATRAAGVHCHGRGDQAVPGTPAAPTTTEGGGQVTEDIRPPASAPATAASLERDLLAHPRKLTPEVARARKQVLAARSTLEEDLDGLSEATRSALDIPAKVRRNPVKSVALAGGAGFLLLGGPRRVIRAATSRIFPARRDPYDGLLPDEVERILRRSGAYDEPGVREALEADFADYLRRKGRQAPPPNATTSLWRTYDALLGPLGDGGCTAAGRAVVRCGPEPGQDAPIVDLGPSSRSGAGGGTRTPTLARHWLLRPACLPFHHSRVGGSV